MSEPSRRFTETPHAIVGAGLVSLDIVLGIDDNKAVRHWAGGTCGNVLAALAYLGWQAFPVARLGKDHGGAAVLADLREQGVDLSLLFQEEIESTRIVQKLRVTRRGELRHRFLFSCPSCGSVFPRFRPPTLDHKQAVLAKGMSPDVFFFDRTSPAVIAMAEEFSAKGSLVYFEPSGIGRPDLFDRAVELSDVVKYSAERMHERLSGKRSLRRRGRHARPVIEVETMGADGLRYRFPQRTGAGGDWRPQAAFRVSGVRDTAGAGDWCTAGLLYQLGFRRGEEPQDLGPRAIGHALTFGQAIAALNCQHLGARAAVYGRNHRDFVATVLQVTSGDSSAEADVSMDRPASVLRTGTNCEICLT